MTDQGSNYVSTLSKYLIKLVGTIQVTTTTNWGQSNGLVEHINQYLQNSLSMYIGQNQSDWDTFIPYIQHAYNTSVQESIQETPYFMIHGRQCQSVLDIQLSLNTQQKYVDSEFFIKDMLKNVQRAHILAKKFNDKAREKQPIIIIVSIKIILMKLEI